MRGKVTTDTRHLDRIIANLDDNNNEFLRYLAFSVEAKAKMKSPVLTGANRNSIYTNTGNTIAPAGSDFALPDPPKNVVRVGPSMEYSMYLETGTRRMAAQPYLAPAVAEVSAMVRGRASMVIND